MSTLAFSPSKRHVAIAEMVLFSLIQIIQCSTRLMQEWKYWHHNKRKSVPRCIFYSWYGLIGLVAQLRIAGSGMVLSGSQSKKVLISEAILQGIGLSPLLFEVSLVMLRSGQTGRTGPGNSRYPKTIRLLLHFFRFPVFFGVVLIVVGESADVYACKVVGSVVLVLIFAFGCGLFVWVAVAYRTLLPEAGHRCVLLVLAALPFFIVRIAYMLLAQYGPPKFNPANGDVGVMVGMGLLMEIVIMIILLSARAVAEPVWGGASVDVEEARV
ncbi:uncharacterized protein BDW43DRAFT_310434 [Aspergillus alliaceus]|uniref:uncharacterized protein n=1 Tax=Petromyces alliaceus TaxID=209559 RepID=UPI0012A4095B|nr:uncharacterized protein BDW43DRAFT_310434 [Aspergillus alliaceus]KAB8234075.1 hypothetical protein BDW43DRAFT_310434 [Aspergillus alliaceus]